MKLKEALRELEQKGKELSAANNKIQQLELQAGSIKIPRRIAQVAGLIAEGKSNKQIAELFGISPRTIDKHREMALSFFRKLTGDRNFSTQQMTHMAIRLGLTKLLYEEFEIVKPVKNTTVDESVSVKRADPRNKVPQISFKELVRN